MPRQELGSIAYWLQALGLYFIVHDPSG